MIQHDEMAIPIIRNMLKEQGLPCYDVGVETDREELRQALLGRHDTASIMFRFRPDLICLRPGRSSVLIEAKSEGGRYRHFSVEVDSYRAARHWDAICPPLMYAFADLSQPPRVYACWGAEIPEPLEIRVPQRWDAAATEARIRAEFPNTTIRQEPYNPDPYRSGTPYLLIPKKAPYLRTWDKFVANELLR